MNARRDSGESSRRARTPQPRTEPGDWRKLLAFYAPLVLTSQMMTLSNPLINLALSRSEDPQLQLAAYSVCFGLAVFLNAPTLVARDVGSGLCSSRSAYFSLLRQVAGLGLVVSVIDLALASGFLSDLVFIRGLGATPRVAEEARHVALSMSPIPLLVGIRGLNSALALRAHRTRLLTQATFLRLLTVMAILASLFLSGHLSAGAVGWSLSGGIALETLWIVTVTRGLLAHLPTEGPAAGDESLRRMLRFSTPLIVSAYAWTALRPLVNGILGRCADSEAAQAGFGVLHPLILLAASGLWALQATGQILATDPAASRRFLRFALAMTVLFAGFVVLIGWIPAWREFLLTRVFTLPENLLDYVQPPMKILFIAPLLLGIRASFKGLILASGRTGVISLSATADLLSVATVGITVLAVNPTVNGALLGVILLATAEFVESIFLGSTAIRRAGIWPRQS